MAQGKDCPLFDRCFVLLEAKPPLHVISPPAVATRSLDIFLLSTSRLCIWEPILACSQSSAGRAFALGP